jgi:Holliday junction resolvase-like predicted endonuclease
MKVEKSSRHSKITGDFAESLVLYWLSKYGFESAKIDHTGIDLISRNNKTGEIMGISIKSRSRNDGKEGQYVSITNDSFEKAEKVNTPEHIEPSFR